jgi:hypothetical protein
MGTERTWTVKANDISVLIQATGTISKSLTQYLSNKPGRHEIKELQKHCTLTRVSANIREHNIFHGQNNIIHSANCKYRTRATLYTLETWFV